MTPEQVEAELAIHRRNDLLIFGGHLILVLVIVDTALNRIVVRRLKSQVAAARLISQGHLDQRMPSARSNELNELSRAVTRMAEDLRHEERVLAEQSQELAAKTERFEALSSLALTVCQSLDLEHVLDSALSRTLDAMDLGVGWIMLYGEPGNRLYPVASRSLIGEDVATARWQERCRSRCVYAMERGAAAASIDNVDHYCPSSRHFLREGLGYRACIPLRSRDRVVGLMTLLGKPDESGEGLPPDAASLLAAIARQIGIAVENANLHATLSERESLRRHLLERVISAQEEERKRIARELHDHTSQSLTSLLMMLKAAEDIDAPGDVSSHAQEIRRTVAGILQGVRDLALELRPLVLDDLGLMPALHQYVREWRDEHRVPVDMQLLRADDERLPADVETTIYRILQEALTNVGRHAQASGVSVILERRGASVRLIVEDDGRGFDVASVMSTHIHAGNLGLYGMRERAMLLGGTLTVESSPGVGTTVFVEIPLNGHGGS